MTLLETPTQKDDLESVLDQARRRIEVRDEELLEARKRRDAVAASLRAEFAGSRTYVNGSIAHGDALTPLTDVDLGVVVPDPDHIYGPYKTGPSVLQERAAAAIRRDLKEAYGDIAVELKGRKRSILVRFRDPVTPGQPDFTADVIVAIDNPAGAGLFIPRFNGWDRSDPETHTRLVRAAVKGTNTSYARVVRLVKHWNRTHDKPLCSWNIKALALGCITSPVELIEGLRIWFEYAADELNLGETEDPAGVAPHPIKISEKWNRTEVVRELRRALQILKFAIQLESDGYELLAQDELAKLFKDESMLPHPPQAAVRLEQARRTMAERHGQSKQFGAPALITSTASPRDRVNAQSWSA
ncbi:nucleotidyltransferase (plasmid) [Leifsonia sp. P73]|uniref:nucleotidyltransferase n=1 Tax=unclassified Leifsonia TaxID=2663824 RepID=UPI0037038F00